jgi:hypothetical protein
MPTSECGEYGGEKCRRDDGRCLDTEVTWRVVVVLPPWLDVSNDCSNATAAAAANMDGHTSSKSCNKFRLAEC